MRSTVKMSEAILLGYPEIGHTNSVWLHHDLSGKCEGCAIGAALYAMGVTVRKSYAYIDDVSNLWPWTREYKPIGTMGFMSDISKQYEKVVTGQQTIEQLAEWVRAIEAKYDPEPCAECGHIHVGTCEHERSDSYESGYAPMALGPCGCKVGASD